MTDPIARHRALASSRRLLRGTLVATALLMLLGVLVGWSTGGASGAASAAVGIALTGVLFTGGLLGLHRAAGAEPRSAGGVGSILAAFGLRIFVYAAAFALVSRAEWVHGPSLALATAASIALMLGFQILAAVREPIPELETGATDDRSMDERDSTDETSTTGRSLDGGTDPQCGGVGR